MTTRQWTILTLSFLCLHNIQANAAGQSWPVARGPAREPAPYRYEPKMLKQVPQAFLDDASACFLYYGTTHLVDADGTIETITHDVTRLAGRKGIDRLGEYRNVSYNPAFQKLTLNEARIHKANGKVVATEPKHVQLRDAASDGQSHSPDKQLVISFPELQVGDVFEVKWTVRGKNPEHAGHFFSRHSFDDSRYPVVREEVRVRLPKNMSLKYAALNGQLEETIRDDGDDRLHIWRASNRQALPRDADLPSKEELRLQLICSTFSSWEQVGEWKQQLRSHCWTCTPEIRRVIAEATKGCKTPPDKARALTYWVRQNIRYLSVKHGYTPHQPGHVLANRFGDCKDQTQLLAVMLQEIGLRVYLVTLGTQDDGQIVPDVPSPWGTHALLLVPIDGRDHWIDTTIANAPWDFLTLDNRDRAVYLTHGEAIGLGRTPALPSSENRFEQTTQVTVRTDGTTHSQRTLTYHGAAAQRQRQNWIETPPGERRRLMSSVLQDANSRSRLHALAVDERALLDFAQPVRGEVTFAIPRHFTGQIDREGSFTDSHVWNRLLAYTLDYDRKVPMELGSPFESRHHYVIDIPPAFRFDGLPAERLVSSRWGSFQITVTRDARNPRRLHFEFHTKLDRTRIEPADFAAYRSFHEEVNRYWRVWLTLTPTNDLADAPLLALQLALTPTDRTTATVLARMCEQNGRREDARRVLEWTRLAHPSDEAIWEASVKLAVNQVAEARLLREMIQRFAHQAKHVLALGTSFVRQGDYVEAEKLLGPLAESATASVRGKAHYQLARCGFLQKQPAVALAQLQAAQQADPDSFSTTQALLFKASIHEQFGQFKEARESYQHVLRLDANSEDALGALVRLALMLKDRPSAVEFLRRYTTVVGGNFDGLLQAAQWNLQLGRSDDAFELAMRARGQQFNADVQRILGLIHLERGEFTKAVVHLDRAERDTQVIGGLIQGYLALGKLSEAMAAAQTVETLASPALELKLLQLVTTRLGQRRDEYLTEFRGSAEDKARWARALEAYLCAEQAYVTGRARAHVEKLLRGAFSENLELGPALALRAQLWLDQGRLIKALPDAEKATTLSPREPRAFLVRGRIRLERGELAALADLTKAAELSRRKNAGVLHWLAAAQAQAGRLDEALATQRAAVKLRPRDPEMQEQLRDLERSLQPKDS